MRCDEINIYPQVQPYPYRGTKEGGTLLAIDFCYAPFLLAQKIEVLNLPKKSTFSKEVSPSFLSTNRTFSHIFFLAEIISLKIIFSYSEKHWMIFRPEN